VPIVALVGEHEELYSFYADGSESKSGTPGPGQFRFWRG
jgi:hypothetical protein